MVMRFSYTPPFFRNRSGSVAAYRNDLLADLVRAEQAGIGQVLVVSNCRDFDNWALAQFVLERSSILVPLIAVHPHFEHPFAAAQRLATIGALYPSRAVSLNLISGAHMGEYGMVFAGADQSAFSPAERRAKMTEFFEILHGLVDGASNPITYSGKHFATKAARLEIVADTALLNRCYISGSSLHSRALAQQLGCTLLANALPLETSSERGAGSCLRVGMIARSTNEEAKLANELRFPGTREGEILFQFFLRASGSAWSEFLRWSEANEWPYSGVYSARGMRTQNHPCAYLVGSYQEVADYIQGYRNRGVSELLLDTFTSDADYEGLVQVKHLLR